MAPSDTSLTSSAITQVGTPQPYIARQIGATINDVSTSIQGAALHQLECMCSKLLQLRESILSHSKYYYWHSYNEYVNKSWSSRDMIYFKSHHHTYRKSLCNSCSCVLSKINGCRICILCVCVCVCVLGEGEGGWLHEHGLQHLAGCIGLMAISVYYGGTLQLCVHPVGGVSRQWQSALRILHTMVFEPKVCLDFTQELCNNTIIYDLEMGLWLVAQHWLATDDINTADSACTSFVNCGYPNYKQTHTTMQWGQE